MSENKLPAPHSVTLEICIASVADALAAKRGGADRLELNSALALGGLTPSYGLIHEVSQTVDLPLIVMIRPRAGGFCYSAAEFAVMQRDVDTALELGAQGIAFGVLRPNGQIDLERCEKLVAQAASAEAVFHRAFDFIPNPLPALEQLVALGVKRIMTSGWREAALAGADQIRQLVEAASGRIEVLPAGKINAACAAEVLTRTGCRQVHAAVRRRETDGSIENSPAGLFDAAYEATCPQLVRELRAAVDAI